ncbi:MAG TPA: DEAD/DEAH box helicase [Candidatus Brocadiia bacterium]|nr:DEAD/DEAH box helicase [Candidatus Brocadiia bacterium]
MDRADIIRDLKRAKLYRGQIAETRRFPAREAETCEPPRGMPPVLEQALRKIGVVRLFSHQARAIELLRGGRDVVVATGTSSGKTLCYNLAVAWELAENPASRALYLFPTKALAQDQFRAIQKLADSSAELSEIIRPATYDGDTPQHRRRKAKAEGSILLTNPDMLHVGILPYHGSWSAFLGGLKYIVIDEAHTYRGVFGAHVANVLRRLRRLCAHYGADPRFVCCSATIGNPVEFVETLTGRRPELVDTDGSPRGDRDFVLWNPPLTDCEEGQRRSPIHEAQQLFCRLVKRGIQTIVFAQTRATTELIYKYSLDALGKRNPEIAKRISSYRGGYLPEDRRRIESQLFSGQLLGVVATSALELGIDVGGVGACILVGFPDSIARTFQQAGRAGRGTSDSVVFLVALGRPIDQYIMRHPDFIFGGSPEHAVADVQNPYLLSSQLACAAYELPIEDRDEKLFGPYMGPLLQVIEDSGKVRRIGGRRFWSAAQFPAGRVGIRSAFGDPVSITVGDGKKETILGEVDAACAQFFVHPGAVYLHEGRTYLVHDLDMSALKARVEEAESAYYTTPDVLASIQVLETDSSRELGNGSLQEGELRVVTRVVGFCRRQFHSGRSMGREPLELPETELLTTGMWLAPPGDLMAELAAEGLAPASGLAGLRNLFLAVLPVLAMCDRHDVEAACDTAGFQSPALFLYDTYPGGAGFSRKAFEMFDRLALTSLRVARECPCRSGCPSCVGAADPEPQYVTTAQPDKRATTALLERILV